ncbi:hypothetical protein [Streptomyces sp. XY332]|uniref:hypothetical protein n=1 Tax=Streptomyces sp. XY332 TaxID=1415561 RepID=UPI001F38EFB1|nr:hypothetical protein [Streptomyces sp. XY332]
MVAELRDRGIGFTSLHENLDTRRPARRPCVRRPRRVHPRAHRHRHQRGPGAPTRAWPPPASAGAPPSPPRKSSRPPATGCPTPARIARWRCPRQLEARRGRRAPARSVSPGFPVPQPLISDHGIGVPRSFPCGRVGPTGPSRGRSEHGSRRSDRRRHRVGPRLSARGGREECG